jgi:hypothetical protein
MLLIGRVNKVEEVQNVKIREIQHPSLSHGNAELILFQLYFRHGNNLYNTIRSKFGSIKDPLVIIFLHVVNSFNLLLQGSLFPIFHLLSIFGVSREIAQPVVKFDYFSAYILYLSLIYAFVFPPHFKNVNLIDVCFHIFS